MVHINFKRVSWIIISVLFLTGFIIGAFYLALSEEDKELYLYLSGFFEGQGGVDNQMSVFKASLLDNLKLSLILLISGFFRIGAVTPLGCAAVKGFVNGFSVSAFVRYYGIKGLFVPLSSIISSIIYIPVLIVFCARAFVFSIENEKKDKTKSGKYLIFSLACFSIFCVVSFFDGYVTTKFIKLLTPIIITG